MYGRAVERGSLIVTCPVKKSIIDQSIKEEAGDLKSYGSGPGRPRKISERSDPPPEIVPRKISEQSIVGDRPISIDTGLEGRSGSIDSSGACSPRKYSPTQRKTSDHEIKIRKKSQESIRKSPSPKSIEEELENAGLRKPKEEGKSIDNRSIDNRSRDSPLSVILQMPRGNIEVIYPRPMVVLRVLFLLDNREYRRALLLMRKHRIDMNLAVDHLKNALLEDMQDFVRDLDDSNLLNIFIADLKPEDVTRTLYTCAGVIRDQKSIDQKESIIDKVNTVCKSLRSALESIEPLLLTPIISTYLKQTPPEIGLALARINQAKHEGLKSKKSTDKIDKPATSPTKSKSPGIFNKINQSTKPLNGTNKSINDALNHLICLSNVDELWKAALATFDFDLVHMVAEKSQRDPKEYRPFLEELGRLEPDYRKFRICDHLKDWKGAIGHLAKAGNF